ncbi:MAG: SDR family NAD(P)-dependent oxidoreductase [Candidatus Scalindua sp.]
MTSKQILITGGAGFIGVNAAKVFSQKGWDVTVMDNLSRNGAESNLEWLQRQNNINFIKDDIRNRDAVVYVFRRTKY